MSQLRISQIETPIAVSSGNRVWLALQWCEQGIASINFKTQESSLAADVLPLKWLKTFGRYWDHPLSRETLNSLRSLPLILNGTDYQRQIWSVLQQIPTGETATYGSISDRLRSSPRAVAAACRANPSVLAVPCHRVVSKSGIGGFMGATKGDSIDIKQWLIDHER